MYQQPSSKPDKKIEHIPGIGEVIVAEAQDRFEARPHFSSKGGISSTYLPPAQSNPSPTYLPPSTTSVPVAPRPSSSLYDSPYNSYNPPVFKPEESYSPNNYPPHGNSDDSYSPPESSKQSSKTKPTADSYVSLGPPVAPHDDYDHPGHNDDDDNDHPDEDDHPMHDDHEDFEPHDFHKDSPQDPMAMYKNQDGPPKHPPKSFDDVYYPPDFPKDQIPNGHAGGMHSMQEMPPDDQDPMPPDDENQDMMPPDNHDMMPPEDMDDEPKSMGPPDHMDPPPHEYEAEHGHAFPQYLYDHHHYNQHVYEEIPHMAPAKEDKRVSSTHYSYYYLGRKLWYIPLYFSIYFIIYVTVLIVKSIARHKVKLKYKWYEHDQDAKQARSLNLDDARREEVDNIHRNVSVALANATAKYDKVLAMK